MSNPDFMSACIGGLLIGAAAVLLMAATGRIAGVSGMASRLLPPYDDGQTASRAAFVAGLLAAPWLFVLTSGKAIAFDVPDDMARLVSAGLLVGFGAVLGGGCTSGHGVCGIARLSRRSLAATATFMVTAMLTLFVDRHLLGG
jgi:uncharacterized membrane protein YedE/YeeE